MTKKLILILCLLTTINATKIKLSAVKVITLTAGQFTTGRRSAPVLQLQCRGELCNHAPDKVQCTNEGSDGLDIQWSCEGDLLEWLSFKDSNVSCEGYDYPTDPYILIGSCGMSYSLKENHPYKSIDHIVSSQRQFDHNVSGGLILLIIIILICCNTSNYYSRHRNDNSPATAAALGAAAGYAAGRSRSWGGGPRRAYSRRWHQKAWFSGAKRKAKTFSGTSRR